MCMTTNHVTGMDVSKGPSVSSATFAVPNENMLFLAISLFAFDLVQTLSFVAS